MIEQLNELQLNNDLTTIETEIKSYQNIAGQSIFEIGRRLKHVKENDLAHGEYGSFLKSVGLTKSQSDRFVKIYSEHSQGKLPDVGNIGMSIVYEISTLPEPERTKEHITSKGKVKTPDEMTVRELRELKKQLKQRDEQNAQLQSQVEQAHLTTKTLFHIWLNSMYTRAVVLYLHNTISTINNSITKACTGTILP